MDTKEYPFLVKFGEDIRQDQRIEQLFSLMNDIYRSDTTCSNNGLQIITYQVSIRKYGVNLNYTIGWL